MAKNNETLKLPPLNNQEQLPDITTGGISAGVGIGGSVAGQVGLTGLQIKELTLLEIGVGLQVGFEGKAGMVAVQGYGGLGQLAGPGGMQASLQPEDKAAMQLAAIGLGATANVAVEAGASLINSPHFAFVRAKGAANVGIETSLGAVTAHMAEIGSLRVKGPGGTGTIVLEKE